jgi:VIT1/CCC1 family predicted Fe2+/Mn2+ transporter
MLLYWLAEAYAHHEGLRLREPVRWGIRDTFASLTGSATVLLGAAVPIVALLFAWLVGASLEVAVTAALWCAGVELAGFELFASVYRRLGRRDMAVQTTLGLAMGVAILGVRLLLH